MDVYNIHRRDMMSIMNIRQVTEIQVRTDIVVMGSNPENADYDNPRGYIYGYRGYLLAIAPDGSQWVFERTMADLVEQNVFDRLATFCAHVQHKINCGVKLDVNRWTETRPAYGSEAYANGGWSREDAMEERCADENRDGEF